MTSKLKRRRPRRRAPSATSRIQADLPPEVAVDAVEPETPPLKPVRLSSPIATVERFECLTCDSVVPLQNVTSKIDEHPTVNTLQRKVVVDCPHCGDVYDATLILINGAWSPESCDKRS